MRSVALLLLVALAPLAVGAPGPSQSGHATGAFVVQEWDIHDFWLNGTAPRWVNLTVAWTTSPTRAAEDLSFTVYKPGVWDAKCPPSRSSCAFVQQPGDIYAQSRGCPPFNNGKEGGPLKDMPPGRYHVVVEGNLGLGVPYTLTTDAGTLGYNGTSRVAGSVYVLPC